MQTQSIIIRIFLLCMLSFSMLSCKKFLAAYSQNNSFIESISDLDELLIGDAYIDYKFQRTPPMLYVMDDDIEMGIPTETRQMTLPETGFHYWQAEPRTNAVGLVTKSDDYFSTLYSRIARINTIILNASSLKEEGEPLHANRILGEAHFLRAYYYFMLVNIYGKPYRQSTAAFDFAVPLKTDPAVLDQFSARSTTEKVYDQILKDLLLAEQELLEANQSSTLRANQSSVQALLSRVYLYMEDYKNALHYADIVIRKEAYQLTNLNDLPIGGNFLWRNAPEVIFTMGSNDMASIMQLLRDIPIGFHYKPSGELMQLYTEQDLRLNAFFVRNSKGQIKGAKAKWPTTVDDVSNIYLLRLSEIYLNKAEALAGLDRFEEARSTLQEFRKNRFKPSELPPLLLEGEALMKAIREERRRELCFETHRWFDLRRYGVNSKYPFSKTIRHRSVVFTGSGYVENGYYELNPFEKDSAAYIVPIANDEINFNQGLISNEIRPERSLKQ